jgi:hypothetical protein
MPSFLQLPGGLPWWATLAILVPAALYGLLFLAMPFSVFGVKSRLEQMEARLDEIQEEIRGLAFRLPEPFQQTPVLPPVSPRVLPVASLVTAPPAYAPLPEPPEKLARHQPELGVRRPAPERGERFEPRLDWPR